MFSLIKLPHFLGVLYLSVPLAQANCEIAKLLFTENRSSFDNLKVRTELLVKKPLITTNSKLSSEIEDLLSEENLIFSTAHGENLREQILDDVNFSFKNKFQMNGKSNATASGAARVEVEAYRLGLSLDAYRELPQNQRPIYGYLQFKKGLNETQTGHLRVNYGEDIWTLKTEKVIDTATFSLGDSMTYKGYNYVFRDRPTSHSSDALAPLNNTDDPHTYFLPFKRNKDLIKEHYLAETTERSGNNKVLQRRENIAKPFYNYHEPWNSTPNSDELLNYIEIQYFKENGTIGLDEIAGFTFTRNPPSKELYDYLRDKKIEILDWRIQSDDPIKYLPFEEGGLSDEAVQELIIAKNYIQRLRSAYYVTIKSTEMENIIIRSIKFENKLDRKEFLIDSGIDPYDVDQILKAVDIPKGLSPSTEMNWRK